MPPAPLSKPPPQAKAAYCERDTLMTYVGDALRTDQCLPIANGRTHSVAARCELPGRRCAALRASERSLTEVQTERDFTAIQAPIPQLTGRTSVRDRAGTDCGRSE